jgi:hypothetical protein
VGSNHQHEYANDVIVDCSYAIISHGTTNNNNYYYGSRQGYSYGGSSVIAVFIFIVPLCYPKS